MFRKTLIILAMMFAILGYGAEAWGQTTYTMQSYSNNVITSDNNATWATTSACGGSELPYALNSKRGAGFQANNTVTSSISVTNASKITVIASSNGNKTTTLAVKVGNTTFGNTVSVPQQNYQTLEFTAPNNTTASGTIEFTITRSSKTLWIGQVIVETDTPSTVAAPTFNPAGGEYYEDKTIELSAEEGCTIYYTTDGTTPTVSSTTYEDAIQLTVPSTTPIKAIAVDGEGNSSNVASATYTLMRIQYTPEQLLAEVEPDNQQYKVVFNSETITEFYFYNSQKRGFYIEAGEEDFLTYCSGTPTDWEVGGKVSGTVTGTWKTYNSLKEFCPTSYDDFSYTPPTQQLPTPTGLEVSNLSMTGATLSWNAVEHASSYTVQVTGDDYDKNIENIVSTNVVLNDLTAGKEYVWTVKAIGDDETYLNSDESEPADFTTPTTVLYNVTIVPAEGGTIKAQIDGEDITQAANGATVSLVANPNTHFTFTSWNVYKTGDESTKVIVYENEGVFTFTMPDYNVTITATFTEDTKYTVTYDKGSADVTGDDPEPVSYYEGDKVSLAENPYTRIGFTFNGWKVKDAEGNDVTVDEGMFDMPASAVTVTATWTEKAPAVITLMDKGAQYGEAINGYVGDNLLATLAAAGVENPTGLATMPDYEFAGWAQNKSTDNPNIINESTAVTANMVLYAVYGKTTADEISWEAEDLADLTSSDVFVITGTNSSGTYSMSNDNGTSSAPAAASVTIENNKITSDVSDNIKWNISGNATDGYTFYPNGSTTTWLYCNTTATSSSNDNLRVGTGNRKIFETETSGYIVTKDNNTKRYYGIYDSQNWRGYTSINSNISDQTFAYYKQVVTPGETTYDFEESAKIYTVTYDANGAEGDVPVEAMFFAQGDEYTLASAEGLTKEHHTFAGWKANTDEQTYAVGEIYTFGEANVTFTAQWNEEQKLTVSYHANGVDSSEGVFAGEIQLTAPANVPNGYTYVGWTTTPIEGVAQSASYFSSYNVTKNVDLYAVFAIEHKDIQETTSTMDFSEETYSDWEIDDKIARTANQGTGGTGDYAGKINTNNTYITFNKKVKVESFGFSFKRTSTNSNYNVYIETSTDNETWTAHQTYPMSDFGNGSYTTKTDDTFDGETDLYVRFHCYNTTATRYVDDVIIRYMGEDIAYSNFCTTVNALSGTITQSDITANTAYYISGVTTINSAVEIAALTNDTPANLIIKDGAQLVFNNSGVKATVEKNIIPYSSKGDKGWYFLAAPMEDFAVKSFTDQANGSGYDLYKWYIKEDGTPIWYNYKAHTDEFETNFLSGRGYLAAYQTTDLLKMQGTLNAGTTFDFTEELNTKDNFTLLGNPFTYDLNWSDFTMNNVYNGCAFVNSTTGTIKYAVGDTTIKVGTGFMVYTEDDDATLSFTKDSESGKSNDILALNLFASNGNGEDNTIIVLDDKNGGFAKADNLNTNAPQIYTERLQTKYGIRNFSTSTKEFNVSFKAAGEGSNTIRLETIGEFDYVHLYDKLLDVDVDMLLEGSYTFEASEDDDTHRFIVRIDKGNTGIDENETEDFVSVYNGEIHISGSGEVQIFDVMGRMVHSEVISGDATISTGGFKSGVYVVRLIGDGWTKAEKIVVRR